MVFAPGAAVGQGLRLVRMMARGGMGSIWVADHLGLKTKVAVKFIDEALDADPSLLLRFEREAAAAAQIRSPHVVQILDHGSIDGRVPYIVMELLEGESLGTRVARLGRLSLDETAVIISHTCKGLSRVHALSFVHRDIKPDNLFLIDSDGEMFVKLLDFGVAKQKAEASLTLTSTGMAVGTPHYMSPEQLLSARDATSATDLWAVGVVAYRALTGKLPFDGETYGALCASVSRGTFERAREIRPELPDALDAWFTRALAPDPSQRFTAAREMAEAFVQAAGLAGSRLAVPLTLPAGNLGETLAAPSESSGPTLAAPELSSYPSAQGGGVRRLPSGASIGGAAVPYRERTRRMNVALVLAGAVAAAAVVAVVALTRGSASAPSAAGTSGVAVSGSAVVLAPPAAPPIAPVVPAPAAIPTAEAQPAAISAADAPMARGADPFRREIAPAAPFHPRSNQATVRPAHTNQAAGAAQSASAPPSAPPIDTDHGF